MGTATYLIDLPVSKLTGLVNKYSALLKSDTQAAPEAFFVLIVTAYALCLKEEMGGAGKADALLLKHIEWAMNSPAFSKVREHLKVGVKH